MTKSGLRVCGNGACMSFGRLLGIVTAALGAAIVAAVTYAVFAVIGGIITMLLWNWLCPELFGLKEIDFYQAWGLTFLCSILFKSSKD